MHRQYPVRMFVKESLYLSPELLDSFVYYCCYYFRYLIFFDIGYAQYVHYHSVNLVMEASPNVWEDILDASRPFIKKYLESQDRPMVKLAKNQTVRVEYNGDYCDVCFCVT